MFDWNDLKYFLAVARKGSTIAAAKSLGVNQSTVHRRLDELERRLGYPLVKRNPTGYRLTDLGEEMRGYAERVEDGVVDFERRLAALGQEVRGTIKVTCPETLGARLIKSRLIEKFNARYPELRVEFVMSEKVLNLAKGEADIAIRAAVPVDEKLVGRKIGESPWAIYASRAYIERHGAIARPADIGRHGIVWYLMGDHPTARWLKAVAPDANIVAHADSLPAAILTVKSGVGLAPMPFVVGENEKGLVRVLGPVKDMGPPVYLLMHRDMQRTPRVRAFFDFVIENLPAIRPLLTGEVKRKDPQRRASSKP